MRHPSPLRFVVAAAAVTLVVLVLGGLAATSTGGTRQLPGETREAPITLTTLTAGERYSCGLTAVGRPYCWGADWYGQLGAGGVKGHCAKSIYAKGTCARGPVEVAGYGRFTAIHAADNHACAIDTFGLAWCWGEGHFGQLGGEDGLEQCLREGSRPGEDMRVACSRRPLHVKLPEPMRVAAIDGGEHMTCAVDRTGAAWCWPYGRNAPRLHVPLDRKLVTIAAGGDMACGLTDERGIRCWDMGEPMPEAVTTPTTRTGWTALDVGTGHACALDAEGLAWCWGSDEDAALGIGHTARDFDPEPMTAVHGDHRFRSIATGAMKTCAIDLADALWCWGRVPESAAKANDKCLDSEWIWPGTNDCTNHPVAVHPGTRFATVAIGASHACALTIARELVCWGENLAGQLGDGSLRPSLSLVVVDTRGVTPAEAWFADARAALVSFATYGGLTLLVVVALVLIAGHRIASHGAPPFVALWLGALVAYTVATIAGRAIAGRRADGSIRTLGIQLLVLAAGLTLYRMAVAARAWWRSGALEMTSAPSGATTTFALPETAGGSRRGITALAIMLGGWALLGATMLSMQGRHYDEVSGGLAMLGLLWTAGVTVLLSVVGGVMSLVRLRRHRDDRVARAAVVLAALTVLAAAVMATWMFWPRER